MHVVIRTGGREREVVVDQRSPEATVGDLLASIGVTADGIDVGGRYVDAELALDEAPIPDGSVVVPSQRHGPILDERLDPPRAVAVVAGAPAGRRIGVRPGHQLRIGRDPASDVVLDCPTVSAAHAVLGIDDTGVGHLRDVGSSNGTWVDGEAVHGSVTVNPGDTFRVGAVVLRLDEQLPADVPTGVDRWLEPGNVPFNRPPRTAAPPSTPGTRAPARPPEVGRGQAFRIASIIAPIIMGGVMVWLLGSPRYALFALMSPIMAVGNWWSGKRQAKKQRAADGESFDEGLRRLVDDVTRLVTAEKHRRERTVPDLAEVLRRAAEPSTRLWERRLDHDDLLVLRLGSGDVPWEAPIEVPDDDPPTEVVEQVERASVLVTSPVPLDLAAGGVVGIVGHRAAGLALARSLVCQAAVLHGPADLGLAVFTEPGREDEWSWAKWLPHVRDGAGRTRLVSAETSVSAEIAASLERAHTAANDRGKRAFGHAGARTDQQVGPVRLYVVDDLALLTGRRAPTRTLLRSGAGRAAGIVLASTADLLPASCTVVVDVASPVGEAEVHEPATGSRLANVVVAGLDVDRARDCARDLARFEDPELGLAGGSVPQLVKLLPLLDLDTVGADDVLRQWKQDLPDPGPNTPIGIGEDGVVHLDLRTDGPHGLVGGTTGSGKSELLRSLVAGMAARVDPEHLVFVLVDYKGGSAFDECTRLPHTVGMVTDLDAHLGERALVSLEAELHHRERTLRDAGVTDLPEYLKAGAPLGPMPRMVVVIDEFATMAAELPDFLDALVGIAQRGRSLGVHMILATQRPRGAVNANIKANTNLRIALRVQDAGDSQDIIDNADAAELSRSDPGRAWIRRGHGDTVLVQSALSTAPAGSGTVERVALGDFGFRPSSAPPPPEAASEDDPTDLQLLVEACRAAFEQGGFATPRKPWLPMPSTELDLAEVLAQAGPGDDHVPFAIADDPAAQSQVALSWELDQGPIAFFGMVGSGTTTALVTLGASVAARSSPDDVHLYGIDFGGGALAALAALPHCGAVAAAGDRETQFRLVRLLTDEIDRRRELDAGERAGEPRLLLFVDDVGAMLAEHDGLEGAELVDGFKKVVQEGAGVGIGVAVTGIRPNAMPMRLTSAISQKLLLKLADPADFGVIGVREKQLPAFEPGRAIHGPTRHVVQIALPGPLPSDLPAAERGPVAIAPLPADVAFTRLGPPSAGPPLQLPVGIDDATSSVATLVVHPGDHVVVAGPPRSGKSHLLQLISAQLRAAVPEMYQLAVLDSARSPLYGWPSLDGSEPLGEMVDLLRSLLHHDRPLTILVDDAPAVEDQGRVLEQAARARPDLHLVVAGRPADLRSGYGHWSRTLRSSRTGVLLQPDLAADGDLFGLRLPRRLPVPLVPGRGFLVLGGEPSLVQFAHPPEEPPRGAIKPTS